MSIQTDFHLYSVFHGSYKLQISCNRVEFEYVLRQEYNIIVGERFNFIEIETVQ